MGWLIGIFIFLVSWVVCFFLTYKIYCFDMKRINEDFTDETRKTGFFFASLHILGVLIAIVVLLIHLPDAICDKVADEESFIGKILRKLEK